MGIRGEIFSSRVNIGSRTYFFNVKENRRGEMFMNIVESKKSGESGFERHSILVYEEDMEDFVREFQTAVEFIRKNKK